MTDHAYRYTLVYTSDLTGAQSHSMRYAGLDRRQTTYRREQHTRDHDRHGLRARDTRDDRGRREQREQSVRYDSDQHGLPGIHRATATLLKKRPVYLNSRVTLESELREVNKDLDYCTAHYSRTAV
jgi:hypothetical protein